MSRTAYCFLALGISVAALAAACGDDAGGDGTGGSGGSGASGGTGGNTAGSAGSAGSGDAGSAGTAAGAGGSPGTGGTAGTGNAGAGNAGTGGAGEEPDGGVPDSGTVTEPDSGLVVDAGGNQGPADSGINGDCVPDFATSTALCAGQNSQGVVIARVTFNGDGTATVVLRGTDSADPGGFTLGDIQAVCTGPEDADCVDAADHATLPAQLALNSEVTLTNVPNMDAAEGELVLANGFASDPNAFTFAYLAWGTNFTSATPSTGGGLNWEARAFADGFWVFDQRIDQSGNQNTFVCGGNSSSAFNGDSSLAAGFGICTADQF